MTDAERKKADRDAARAQGLCGRCLGRCSDLRRLRHPTMPQMARVRRG